MVAFAVTVALLATACVAPSAAPGTTDASKQVVIAAAIDALSLDATNNTTPNGREIFHLMYDPLMHRDRDGKIQPRLAERWERLNDTTWRFYLRKGVNFHNGEPFDARSVKFTLDCHRDPKCTGSGANRYGTYESVEIIDDFTVEVKLKQADPLFIANLVDFLYMSPSLYHSERGKEYVGLNPVGTGPYVFKEWVKGDRIVVTANKDYWRGAPTIETVIWRIIPDSSTRVAALINGEVDIAANIPASQMEAVESSDRAEISRAPGTRMVYIGLKPTATVPAPELADKRVRQAMNYAVNKEAIVESVLNGTATVLGQPLYEASFGYNPNVDPYPYDPEKARQLLRDAGLAGGFAVTMDWRNDLIPQDAGSAIVADLKAVGIDVNFNVMEPGAYTTKLRALEISAMYGLSITNQSLDGSELMNVQFLESSAFGKGFNWNDYVNAEVDALVRKAGSTYDEKTRLEALQEAVRIVHEDAPYIFLWNPDGIFGRKKGMTWSARPEEMIFIYDDVK